MAYRQFVATLAPKVVCRVCQTLGYPPQDARDVQRWASARTANSLLLPYEIGKAQAQPKAEKGFSQRSALTGDVEREVFLIE